MNIEVSYLLTERGKLRIASACPKCQTPAPTSTLRGVVRRVSCPLCEYEYATKSVVPKLQAQPSFRRRLATVFAEWLAGGAL